MFSVPVHVPMIKPWFKHLLVLPLLFLFVASDPALALERSDEYEANRAKLLAYLIGQQLSVNHYSHKALDNELSQAAYSLYLKQLDSQKRFLLHSDVEQLNRYATQIDDEVRDGNLELPLASYRIMSTRIPVARKMVQEILTGTFDFEREETLETDAEKLSFCTTDEELKERWRKNLKYQVMLRYLDLVEDRENAENDGEKALSEADLRKKAAEKVLKSHDNFFDRLLQDEKRDYYDRYFNALSRAFDPHTNYLPPDMKEDFDISMSGSLEGIGATLREEDGYIKVVRIIPGSAAYRQGQLEAEDTILAVAQGEDEPVDITDTRLREAVKLIRGKKGSEVRLTVRKADGKRLIIPIIRDVVEIEETFVKSALLPLEKGGMSFGYIKIPSFYRDFQAEMNGSAPRNVTDDVRKELIRLRGRKVGGLVIDLRNNGGGALADAISVAGLFIKTGPVVQIKNNNGLMDILADHDPAIDFDGPIVVLVNKFSASASEILAGALQDYKRAVVMGGEHTHGKGTVQTMIDLNRSVPFRSLDKYKPLGALKITIQKFYRVSGDSTQYRGVVPDIVLPDRFEYLKTGEQHVEYSLPWDTVGPVNYQTWTRGRGDIGALRTISRQRTEKDEDFVEITKEARFAQERSEKTLESLRLSDLRKERDETRAMREKMPEMDAEHVAVEGDKAKKELSEEDKHALWVDSVSTDPYVEEALLLLKDILAGGSFSGDSRVSLRVGDSVVFR